MSVANAVKTAHKIVMIVVLGIVRFYVFLFFVDAVVRKKTKEMLKIRHQESP